MKVEMQDLSSVAAPTAQKLTKLTAPIQHKDNEKPSGAVSDQVSLNTAIPRHNVETIQRIGKLGDSSNIEAQAIRQIDQNLGIAKDVIDKLKDSLDKIIKNFPPFSPDSKERQEILMSYSSIKKEILRLTFPPPKESDSLQNPLHELSLSGEGKLVTPDLTKQATYANVTTAWQQLGTISGQISSAREQLGNSVKGE